jgi:hypothetical protein
LVKRGDSDAVGLVDIRSIDKGNVTEADWLRLSETSLYKKKRAGS